MRVNVFTRYKRCWSKLGFENKHRNSQLFLDMGIFKSSKLYTDFIFVTHLTVLYAQKLKEKSELQYFELFFGLLFSSLLLLVVTQHFSRCILQPSSLSGNGNGSTWEIVFKVCILVKQDVQEIWSSYSNNDVIVFHVYQSEKRHKKFPETRHEINSEKAGGDSGRNVVLQLTTIAEK